MENIGRLALQSGMMGDWLRALIGMVFLATQASPAATVTVTTNSVGSTPEILAYNSGHFYPGSNTRDWWRYSGVNGARLFISPSAIEPSDDLAPVGDGVTNPASFLARKAALRADPLNPAFINWNGSAAFGNRYESHDLYPNNHIRVNYALGELRRLGIRVCAQITASQSRFPIADSNDWPNMWELWQHYYAQAFYLGRAFDVDRYQMFNEPNHSNARGLTIANHLLRLQLVSDAVQSALADVNRLYGKVLAPRILGPVTSGSADGSYSGWGESVVTSRHRNFLGHTDPGFSLIHVYDYHQYNSSPATFGSDLANLHRMLGAELSPEPRYPSSISEFNTRTGATYDVLTETLDTPAEYSRFGAIAVNLLANSCAELYCFKFSQTLRDPPTTHPVQKNAMHYVDNSHSPYNIGGITKAGEVWRLFNKAFARGRNRLAVVKVAAAGKLDLAACYDPVEHRVCLFSANATSESAAFDIDLTDWNVPAANKVLIEEVSELRHAGARAWTNLAAGKLSLVQNSNSVWLITVPIALQQPERVLVVSQDATVVDGANRRLNFGSESSIHVQNDPVDVSNRAVGLMKFQLPTNDLSALEMALLEVTASTASLEATSQAHVYGCLDTNWTEGTVSWTNAPGLKDSVPAGATIDRCVIDGVGSQVSILGQLVAHHANAEAMAIDITGFLRSITNRHFSILISQDPRWNVALPSLAAGDVQPDGLKIVSREGGSPARLRLLFRDATIATNPPPRS